MRWTDYGTVSGGAQSSRLAERRSLGISFKIRFGTTGSLAMSAAPSLDFDCDVD
jgi:hypothetical protein